MPDTPQPFDLNVIAESLKKTTETITNFVKMVAGWIRDKQWVELISFVLSAVILGYLGRAAIIKFFGEKDAQWFFWVVLVVVILFIVAVVVAVFQKLIQKSQERLLLFGGVIGLISLLVMGSWGGLNHTEAGQLWQMGRDLAAWTEKVNIVDNQAQAATAFAEDEDLPEIPAPPSSDPANQIKDNKASALSAIAETYIRVNQPEEAAKLLKLALDSANQIKDDRYKFYALGEISGSIGKLNQPEEAAKLLKLALDSANQIKDDDSKASTLRGIRPL
jgi:hypothetical protein